MFSLSHVYVATQVAERENNFLVFGSVIPDIRSTTSIHINADSLHDAPLQFYDFAKNYSTDIQELAIGVQLHSPVNRGADYYSDDEKTGYAKQEGQKIWGEVSRLLGEEKQDQASYVLAHNFIEAAVDLHLISNTPSLISLYERGLRSAESEEVQTCLSQYLNVNHDTLTQELKRFCQFLAPEFFVTKEMLINRIIVPLIQQVYKTKVDPEQAKKILRLSIKITQNSYSKFLESTIEAMKQDFAGIKGK